MRWRRILISAVCIWSLIGCAAEHPKTPQFDNAKFLNSSRAVRGAMKLDWQPVAQPVPTDDAGFSKFIQLDGDWLLKRGELVATAGEHNRAILLHAGGHDPVRIALEVTLLPQSHGRIGDVTILLNTTDDKKYFQTGYTLTTSSYWGNCTTFYRDGKAIAHTEFSPVKPGVRTKIVVEFSKGHIRYWVNDQIVLEAWDADPFVLKADSYIGLRTWNTHMIVYDFQILSNAK